MKEKWKLLLWDIETGVNFFCITIEDFYSKEKITLEISERVNQLDEIFKWFTFFSRNKSYLISFNGLSYDNTVTNYIIDNYYQLKRLDIGTVNKNIKEFSDTVIHTKEWWLNNQVRKHRNSHRWNDIDVFLYWSKGLRMSKKISLKSLGIQLNYPIVQELPFDPNQRLTYDEMDETIHYNKVHDLGILRLIVESPIYWQGKPTTIKNEINLRLRIKDQYKLNCLSWDSPKIASEILLDAYTKKTYNGNDVEKYKSEVRNRRFEPGEPLPLQECNFKLPVFQDLFNEMSNASRSFEKTIYFNYKDTSVKIAYGIGGIHILNSNEIYESDEYNSILTSDVESMYPNNMINYKTFRYLDVLETFKETKDERIIAKKQGDKGKDATYKLILNSTSGLIDSPFSWLYYPEGAMKLRLMGQLVITKIIEEVVLANFKLIGANTDGVEVIVPNHRRKEYYKIIDDVGKYFDLKFEHEKYQKIVYANVNGYIAILESGKTKKKGAFFITTPDLGSSCNSLIMPLALEEYYINGTKIEDFIKSQKNIFLFCISQKVDKKYSIIWGNESLGQRINRYYISRKGKYLYKYNKETGKKSHLMKNCPVIIYNNHTEQQEYNIDYDYYINETKNRILKFETNQNQLKLF